MGKYLTIQQAAEMLAVSTDTIRRMLPKLDAVDMTDGKAGRRLIRIPERALEAYLNGCRILPPVPMQKKAVFHLDRHRTGERPTPAHSGEGATQRR